MPGTYGDREVHLCRCIPARRDGPDVILLHGVHSSANLGPRNKFRHLARFLAEKGLVPWLVETSRAAHCRGENESVAEWAFRAFARKSFAQEREDALIAIREVLKRNEGRHIWLWGFPLGGIIAASAASLLEPLADGKPAVSKLIFSGTGLHSYPKVEKKMLKMPILSTLRETLSADMLAHVRAGSAVSFRGEFDEVFSRKSCLEFIRGINLPAGEKAFHTIKGADHSLRQRAGKAAPDIMLEMVDFIIQ